VGKFYAEPALFEICDTCYQLKRNSSSSNDVCKLHCINTVEKKEHIRSLGNQL